MGLIFVRGVCNFFSDYLLAWVANNVLLGMRRDMFERLLGLPDADFKTGDTGRLLNRFTIDAGNVTGYATDVISVLVRETLVVIALICVLLYMSWVLTLIILIMLPVSVLVARVFIKRLRSINRDTVNMNAELTRWSARVSTASASSSCSTAMRSSAAASPSSAASCAASPCARPRPTPR